MHQWSVRLAFDTERIHQRRGPSLEPFDSAEDCFVERNAPSRVTCLAIRSAGKHEFSTCERTVRNLASYVTDSLDAHARIVPRRIVYDTLREYKAPPSFA